MLFGGFLLNKESISVLFDWIKYLSTFYYAYEALIVNELLNVTLMDETIVDIKVPGIVILKQFGYNPNAFWKDTVSLCIIFVVTLCLAFLGLLRVKK